MRTHSFLTTDEKKLESQFLEDGFIIVPTQSKALLQDLQASVTEEANRWLVDRGYTTRIEKLQHSHYAIPHVAVNEIRLHLFAWLNSQEDLRLRYFSLASSLLQLLVGNELAMQNKVNLSIQQPGDPTSVLDLHSDVWSGDSPFQVVLWVPLTDSRSTNAMFLLRPSLSLEAYERTSSGELKSMADIQAAYQEHFRSVDISYGDILVFDSNCLHGNQLNTTESSRWSLNCRLTQLFAPAITPERRLGPYYTPLIVRAATRMGIRATRALGLTL